MPVRVTTIAAIPHSLILNGIDERPGASYVGRVRSRRDTLLQFMILLSALLASLSGLVAGERPPVGAPAQVQASAFIAAAETVAVAAVALVAAWMAFRGTVSRRRRAVARTYEVAQPRLATRLSLKQSWLN